MPPHRPSTTSTPRAPFGRRGNRLSATLQDPPPRSANDGGLARLQPSRLGGEEWTVQGSVGAPDRAGRRREEQPVGHPTSTQAKGWRAAPGTAALHQFPRWRGGDGATALESIGGKGWSRAHPGRRGAKSSECPRPREEPSSLGFPGGVSVLSSRERGLPRSCRHGGSDWRHPRQQSGALRKALWRKAMKDPRLKHRGSRGGGRPETFARPVTRASGERSVGRRTPRHDRALSPLLACVPVVGIAR